MIVGRVVPIVVLGGVVGGGGLGRGVAGGRDEGSREVVRGVGDGGRITADLVGGGIVLGTGRTSSDG